MTDRPDLPPAGLPLPGQGRPLLVCADERLLDDLLRLAAAAGVETEVAGDPGAARSAWAGAALVVVGDDRSVALASAGLPRRPGVVLVSRDLDDPGVWRRAVDLGAEQVAVLPDAEGWLVEAMAEAAAGPAKGRVVCVVGGRGGAGASTLAAALGMAGMRLGLSTVLIDADPLGGGLDLVLGGEDAPGLRWPDLAGATGRVVPSDLAAALPEVDSLHVLSWDRGDVLTVPATAMESVLQAAVRAAGLVVVDLPRRPDDAARVALAAADRAFLVVPAEVRAVAAAGRVARAHAGLTRSLEVVVRGPAPSSLEPGTIADALGLPLAGWCRPEPGLAASLDRGEPPGRRRGPLATLARRLVTATGPAAVPTRA